MCLGAYIGVTDVGVLAENTMAVQISESRMVQEGVRFVIGLDECKGPFQIKEFCDAPIIN